MKFLHPFMNWWCSQPQQIDCTRGNSKCQAIQMEDRNIFLLVLLSLVMQNKCLFTFYKVSGKFRSNIKGERRKASFCHCCFLTQYRKPSHANKGHPQHAKITSISKYESSVTPCLPLKNTRAPSSPAPLCCCSKPIEGWKLLFNVRRLIKKNL